LKKKRHYLVYQITNLINQKIYIGIHSTENVDDGYMGSGSYLKVAIKKHGIENFVKEILFDFDNAEEMILKESELVDRKFIARKDVYNIKLGGEGWLTIDSISVKDSEGNCFRVHKTDERWLSGELVGINVGKVTVKDEEGNIQRISVDDPRWISGELTHTCKGKCTVIDNQGKTFMCFIDDPRLLNGDIRHINSNKMTAVDVHGKYYHISIHDHRLKSGELFNMFSGKTHSNISKKRISDASKIHQKGEGNSQYGSCWIHNDFKNKKIKKEELDSFLLEGWIKGRKMKF